MFFIYSFIYIFFMCVCLWILRYLYMQIELILLMKQLHSFAPMFSSETLILRAPRISFSSIWHYTLMWLWRGSEVAELWLKEPRQSSTWVWKRFRSLGSLGFLFQAFSPFLSLKRKQVKLLVFVFSITMYVRELIFMLLASFLILVILNYKKQFLIFVILNYKQQFLILVILNYKKQFLILVILELLEFYFYIFEVVIMFLKHKSVEKFDFCFLSG